MRAAVLAAAWLASALSAAHATTRQVCKTPANPLNRNGTYVLGGPPNIPCTLAEVDAGRCSTIAVLLPFTGSVAYGASEALAAARASPEAYSE